MSISLGKSIVLVGYSGHALVCAEIFELNGDKVSAYFDSQEKSINPFKLNYLGIETEQKIKALVSAGQSYFIAIADNGLRRKIDEGFMRLGARTATAIHPRASISPNVEVRGGTFIGNQAIINPFVKMGKSIVVNTGAIIEHECELGDYTHIAPGSVICGNVKIGAGTFVGANSTVKQGVQIGENCLIGAGSLVLADIPAGQTCFGSPVKRIK